MKEKKKIVTICIRLTEEEKALIALNAKKDQRSLSNFIRKRCMKK